MANLNLNFNGLTKLKDWWGVIKSNFTAVNDQMEGHINGIQDAHNASKIIYSGNVNNESEVEGALDSLQNQLLNLSFTGSEHDALVQASLIDITGENFNSIEKQYLNGRFNKWESYINNISISVKMFDVKGDGVTDDTINLQNAIDYVGSRGGKLLFPNGTYLYTNKLNITYANLHIIGESNNVILKYSGDSNIGYTIAFDKGGIIGTTIYGDSLIGFKLKNISFEANFEQTFDTFGRPTSWFECCCLYLNGARNYSAISECKFKGYARAIHSVFNWMCHYRLNWIIYCREGFLLEEECNNIEISNNIFRNLGKQSDMSGFACKIIGSYSILSLNNDMENLTCAGFIYEACHGFTHISGDVENNDMSQRKIIIRGRSGLDHLTSNRRIDWSYGGKIIGVRFLDSLGILLSNGTRSINISACTFASSTEDKANKYTIYNTISTIVEDIDIGINDYYGNNGSYSHAITSTMLYVSDHEKQKVSDTDGAHGFIISKGTFNPTIYGLTTAGSPTYNTSSTKGYYIRQGDLVTINLNLVITSKGGMVGALRLGGLPFLSWSGGSGGYIINSASISRLSQVIDLKNGITGEIYEQCILLRRLISNSNYESLLATDINDTFAIGLSLSYRIA